MDLFKKLSIRSPFILESNSTPNSTKNSNLSSNSSEDTLAPQKLESIANEFETIYLTQELYFIYLFIYFNLEKKKKKKLMFKEKRCQTMVPLVSLYPLH